MRTSRIPTTAAVAAVATAALALTMTVVGTALAATDGDGGADGAAPRSTAAFQAAAKPKAGESRPDKPRPKAGQSRPEHPSSTEVPLPNPSALLRAGRTPRSVRSRTGPLAQPRSLRYQFQLVEFSLSQTFTGRETASSRPAKVCSATSFFPSFS
ncbi:hypothetical protein FHS36_005172 [Streptomyces eurocidicus]|uniref:Uncharacterized protein n=1 Tax=Streptomyces eurocidicus TaxID=66423 RepID=A0A7W8BF60_STREU|nr:hypothetical protein [Streptomyces eurocidicus]